MKYKFSLMLIAACLMGRSQLDLALFTSANAKMPGSYGLYFNASSGSVSGNYSSSSARYNFGNGIEAGVMSGYTFKNNFGLNLGASYLYGLTTILENTFDNSNVKNVSTETYYTRMTRIRAGFAYSGDKKISPIMQAGLILGAGKVHYEDEWTTTTVTYTNNSYSLKNDQQKSHFVFEGGFSLGFYSSVGVKFKLSNTLCLSATFNHVLQDYAPNRMTLIGAEENGADVLYKIPWNERESYFVNNYHTNSGGVNNTQPRIGLPLSSIGGGIQLTYIFGKKPLEVSN